MFPHGFDPLNVPVQPDEVLHTRWFKLGNDAGTVEVMGRSSLSRAAGDHPLFTGCARSLSLVSKTNLPSRNPMAWSRSRRGESVRKCAAGR
jgi:hypothetical protein